MVARSDWKRAYTLGELLLRFAAGVGILALGHVRFGMPWWLIPAYALIWLPFVVYLWRRQWIVWRKPTEPNN